MKNWNIRFLPMDGDFQDDGNTFGATVTGCFPRAGCRSVVGSVFYGTYRDVLRELKGEAAMRRCASADCCIVLFVRNTGQDEFLEQLAALYPRCSCVGGTAAGGGGNAPRVYPPCEEVAVLFAGQPARTQTVNLHAPFQEITFTMSNNILTHIDDIPALQYLRDFADAHNNGVLNLEQITLSDRAGKNVHFDVREEGLHPNASFATQDKGVVRYLDLNGFQERFKQFTGTRNSVVFGCAGLQSLVDFSIAPPAGSLIGFFHGEVVDAGKPSFANLMMSKIIFGQ